MISYLIRNPITLEELAAKADIILSCFRISREQLRRQEPQSLIHLQHCQKRFLRNLDPADFLHALLAFLLLFEQFALARDVAAVALGNYILAHRLYGFARDDFRADGRLDG